MSRSNCLSRAIAPADGYTAVLEKIKAGQRRLKITGIAAPQAEAASLKCADAEFATWKPATESNRRI
jgi:hypothetical protein